MVIRAFIHKYVSQNKNEDGIKALDKYSIRHVVCGMLVFLLSNLFTISMGWIPAEGLWLSLISVIFWGILWEFVENFLLSKTRLKVGRRKDSLRNSLTDIVCNFIGGSIVMNFGVLSFVIVITILFTLGVLMKK